MSDAILLVVMLATGYILFAAIIGWILTTTSNYTLNTKISRTFWRCVVTGFAAILAGNIIARIGRSYK